MNKPKYPIYIISKGRADTRLTVKSLETLNVPYKIVIEGSEYSDYAAVIDPDNILVLPSDFREDPKFAVKCEATGLLGGSIPARNFVWHHAKESGAKRHWILDDNIQHFYRLHKNKKIRVLDGACFRTCEDFSDRYENVGMSGMNYAYFAPSTTKRPPYYHNTRVYSCILLNNDLFPDFAWRGKYNEDTDLSLRIMKADYHTFLFNAFLCGKITTLTMKGGNTEDVYEFDQDQYDNRRKFAESLYAQHPDCVQITQKWGRWHHHINYNEFQYKKPQLKAGLNIPRGPNSYGLKLVRLKPEEENVTA